MPEPSPFSQSLPVLSTRRLQLRPLHDDDTEAIFQLRSHPDVNRYIGRTPPTDLAEARAFVDRIVTARQTNTSIMWSIRRTDSPALLGTVCLWNFAEDRRTAELGYELLPTYQGQGYMSEAVQAVLNYGFDTLHLAQIDAFTHRDNTASRQLLQRQGFRHLPDRIDPDVPDNTIWQLTHDTHRA